MPIDISQDLNIVLTVIETGTVTIDGVYDTGSAPGTYVPGKDFGATDDVTTGVVTNYKIGIALTSKSNQIYPIDRLFLQSVDDPQTNGTGIIPLYWINSDPNPQNITDDNQYKLVPNYNANMISVVFDSTSGVTSASTVNLTLAVNYPNGIYWKSKIAPKIVAIAVKDGIQKVSSQLLPTEVRMSSVAAIQNDFYRSPQEWGAINLTTVSGVKGFKVPFYLTTSLIQDPTINTLLDSPNGTPITYKTNLAFTINGTNIPVTLANITLDLLNGTGINIANQTLVGSTYTVTLNNSGTIKFPIVLHAYVFLPFDPGSLPNVTMNMVGSWVNPGVVFTNWVNQYIYSMDTVGGINNSQIINLTFTNPPQLQNNVQTYINPPATSVSSSLTFLNLNMFALNGSKMMLLYDSLVSFLDDTPPYLMVAYTKPGEVASSQYVVPTSDFTQQFGYVPLPAGYNANTLCQNAFNGMVTLGSYQSILAGGNKPNILITTFLVDILAGLTIDYTKYVNITYQKAQTPIISNTAFLAMYNANPSGNFTSYLYTSMRLGTNFATVADANAKYGSQIASVDSFASVSSKVVLNMGTVTKGSSGIAFRFGVASTVRFDANVPVYTSNCQTSISTDNINTLTTISDYTQTYPLRFFIKSPSVQVSSASGGIFLAGNVLKFTIPANILPYIYLAGNPAIYLKNINVQAPILQDTIVTYSLTAAGISITIPNTIKLYNTGLESVYVEIPVRFLVPAVNQVFNHQTTTFNPNLLLLSAPNQLVDQFTEASPYYNAPISYVNSTLMGAGIDFTGLTVNKNYYPNGTPVLFIANTKNQNNPTDSFYMALTVPTNKYNPLETSDNNQLCFVNKITTFSPSTVLYYQTAAAATPADIAAMKTVGANLQAFYNTTVVTTWIPYTNGQSLPSDVVMMVAYTPNVPTGGIVRVDYECTVQMDPLTTNVYINKGVFNYYSTASTLGSQSNAVTIQNYLLVNNIVLTKSPATQTLEGKIGSLASFTLTFDVPANAFLYNNLTFIDPLPKALKLLPTSTLQIGTDTPTLLNATMTPDKVVSYLFTNMNAIAGKKITIVLNTSIDQLNNIPVSLTDINKANLLINGDPKLSSTSNSVDVTYFFPNPFNINKKPLTQTHPKVLNEKISFEIFFTVPTDVSAITSMVITDTLASALTYDPANSLIQIGTSLVKPLVATVLGQVVTINFADYILAAGQIVKITLGTTLTNLSLVPPNGVLLNNATLKINNIPAYQFTSNTVEVLVGVVVNKVPVFKAPATQSLPLLLGTVVPVTLSFTVPTPAAGYTSFTITDALAPALTYSNASTIVYGAGAPIPLVATVLNNVVTIELINMAPYAGQVVTINLKATLTDLSKLPANNQITNVCDLTINHDATLKSISEVVNVTFVPDVKKVPVFKAPATQSLPLVLGTVVPFTLSFTVPTPATGYTSFTITDALAPALTYSNASTIVYGAGTPIPLVATVLNNVVTIELINMAPYAGQVVTINLKATLTDLSKLPANNQITNVCELTINHDATLKSVSEVVNVTFVPDVKKVPVFKAPATQSLPLVLGTVVPFTLSFTVPTPATGYTSFTITDTLAPALTYSNASTIVYGAGAPVPLVATVLNNVVTVELLNLAPYAGQVVTINLKATLTDLSKLPANNQITNVCDLTINHDATLKSVSEVVNVTFVPDVKKVPVFKAPATQSLPLVLGTVVPFTLSFTVPTPATGYTSFTITDTLAPALTYSNASTIVYGAGAPVPLVATVLNNVVTVELINMAPYAGQVVTINLKATLTDLSKLPANNQITNVCDLTINHDATLKSISEVVNVTFVRPMTKSPVKKCDTEVIHLNEDKVVTFDITFYTNEQNMHNMLMTIEDLIDINLTIVSATLNLTPTGNIAITDASVGNDIKFLVQTNYPGGTIPTFPASFSLTIVAKYKANTITDSNYVIKNFATIQFGTEPLLSSNVVIIALVGSREQAITDVIESVALQQAGLAHILNAEGEKIQKFVSWPNVTPAELLAVNESVANMIDVVADLETVLASKLHILKGKKDCLCPPKKI